MMCLLLLVTGTFSVFWWLSGSVNLELDATLKGDQIIGEIKDISPVGKSLRVTISFFVSFFAGAVFLNPLLDNLRLLRHPNSYKYKAFGDTVTAFANLHLDDDLRNNWGKLRNRVVVQLDFDAVVETVEMLRSWASPPRDSTGV